jgi:hypothetical protein
MVDLDPSLIGEIGEGLGVGSDALSPLGADKSAPSSENRSQGDSADTSNAGITLTASQQASLVQDRPPSSSEVSPSQDQGSKELQPLGTLNVGDRFVSTRQNSPETVQAASTEISGTATMSLAVPESSSASPSPSSSPPSSVDSKASNKSDGGSSGFFSKIFSRNWHYSMNEEEKKRHYILAGISEDRPRGSFTPMGAPASSPTTAIGPGTQRYIFSVHDVHDMGGTPSRLSILDAQSGDTVGSYDLSPGNSTLMADLPPGQYTIEAQSGSRSGNAPNAGPDDLDNFRVDVSSAGPTPTGGGPGGGGGAAPSK